MKKVLLMAVAVFLGAAVYQRHLEAPGHPHEVWVGNAAIDPSWFYDASGYEKALVEQALTKRAMLIYFYADWCPYCKKFEKEVLFSPDVKQYLLTLLTVRINPEHGRHERKIADDFNSHGYPMVFILPADKDEAILVQYNNLLKQTSFINACKKAEGKGLAERVRGALKI